MSNPTPPPETQPKLDCPLCSVFMEPLPHAAIVYGVAAGYVCPECDSLLLLREHIAGSSRAKYTQARLDEHRPKT